MSKTDGIGTWVWNSDNDIVFRGMYTDYMFNFTSNGENFSGMRVGYVISDANAIIYYLTDSGENVLVFKRTPGNPQPLVDDYRTFDILTSPPNEFIQSILPNATYQEPKPTDLTGTTWKFNGTYEAAPSRTGFTDYSVNWISGSGETGTFVYVGLPFQEPPNYFSFGTASFWDSGSNTYGGNVKDNLLSFTGGTDATNTDLINYLYANAELQGSAPTKYKVNVALEHCTRIGGDLEVEQGGNGSITVQCDTGYVLRDDKVKITNANFDRITDELDTTGASIGQYKIYFSNATGEVTVSAIATIKSYKLRVNGIYVRANGQTSGVMTLKEYKDGTLLRTMNYNWDNSDVVTPPVVETGYTVTLNLIDTVATIYNETQYMTNDGDWITIGQNAQTPIVLNNVIKIKFRNLGGEPTIVHIGTTTNGHEIASIRQFTTSEDIVITSDAVYYISYDVDRPEITDPPIIVDPPIIEE